MVRAILAAIAGYLMIGLLVTFTDQVFTAMQGFNSAGPPRSYFLISIVTDSFYSCLGGYLCAGIAKQNSRLATLILLIGGELIGVVAFIMFWRSVPHWFGAVLLVLYPACVRAGSQFHKSREVSAASI